MFKVNDRVEINSRIAGTVTAVFENSHVWVHVDDEPCPSTWPVDMVSILLFVPNDVVRGNFDELPFVVVRVEDCNFYADGYDGPKPMCNYHKIGRFTPDQT